MLTWREVEEMRPELLRLARARLRSLEDAEDAVQEALIRAAAGAPMLRRSGSMRAWMRRILWRVCLDVGRARAARTDLPLVESSGASSPDFAPALIARMDAEEAAYALPRQQREPLLLFARNGLSMVEAAAALGIEVSAIRRRLHEARVSIRQRSERGKA